MKKEAKASASMNELEDPEICIAAMADCFFVLLTFFITICSLDVQRTTMSMDLPMALNAREIKERPGWAYIHVEWDYIKKTGKIYYGQGLGEMRQFSDPEMLASVLGVEMSRGAGIKAAYIRAEKGCQYYYLARLAKVIAEAGIPNLVYGTYQEGTQHKKSGPDTKQDAPPPAPPK